MMIGNNIDAVRNEEENNERTTSTPTTLTTSENEMTNRIGQINNITFQLSSRAIPLLPEEDYDENRTIVSESISDRPGAFRIQGINSNNNEDMDTIMEDGTILYSMGAVGEDTDELVVQNLHHDQIQAQESLESRRENDDMDPLEAERVPETVHGTEVSFWKQQISQTWWKQVTIFLGVLFIVLLVTMAASKNNNNQKSNSNNGKPINTSNDDAPVSINYNFPSAAPTETTEAAIQSQLMEILLEFLPDLKKSPSSSEQQFSVIQQQAFDWMSTDSTSWDLLLEIRTTNNDNDNEINSNKNSKRRSLLERFVLATIYFATGGPIYWTSNIGWLSESIVCQWYGVQCLSTEAHSPVGYLQLVLNKLRGTIPSEIGLLTDLNLLYLRNNPLSGSIPTEIGLLTNLTWIRLSGNVLTGKIPTEIGLLHRLIRVDLPGNMLSGSIPSEFGILTNLKSLTLSGSSLTGFIPTQLGLLTDLTRLDLRQNTLIGTIPSELGLLTSLTSLALDQNLNLFGILPTELSTMILPNLDLCFMGGNPNLSGIPENCQGTFQC